MKAKLMLLLFILCAGVVKGYGEVDGNEVEVLSSTLPSVAVGSRGVFDTTVPAVLIYKAANGSLPLPYEKITHVAYTNPLARHLGVLGALGVALVRKRERKHLIEVTWTDADGTAQMVTFEVSKTAPVSLLDLLRVRAPQANQSRPAPRWEEGH